MKYDEHEQVTKQSNSLRLELKLWEKDFAAANGRKAGREDIKKNSDIAQKYKDYNRTRDILAGKDVPRPQPKPKSSPLKRKYEDEHIEKTSKRLQLVQTPSKVITRPWEVDPYESPSVVRSLFTPAKKAVIKATPQKDGYVLGIFDLIEKTPKKMDDISTLELPIGATPRKSGGLGSASKHSRTPSSTRKQSLFANLMTPSKSRNRSGEGAKTPVSISKHYDTPMFLRRGGLLPMPVVDENGEVPDLPSIKPTRKPFMKPLTQILADLRKMEDDAADEDLEALREIEDMDNAKTSGAQLSQKPAAKLASKPLAHIPEGDVLVRDSQSTFPLGGFDDEAQFDSEPEEAPLGRDGQPLKVYKKKGQKRTTRRVNMKPSRSKPAPRSSADTDEDDDDELGTADGVIPETQKDASANFSDARNFDSDDSQSEYTASEGGTRYKRPDQSKKAKRITKDGKIKTAARRVKAVANQNFKRLKLRNSGAKGGPAHNSRFRRKK